MDQSQKHEVLSPSLRAVVFDLDGTLADTLSDIAAAVNSALVRFGLPTHKTAEYRLFLGFGSRALIEKAVGPERPDLYDAVYAAYRDDYAQNVAVFTKPYRGVEELLKRLRAAGYKIYVLTNKPQELASELLEALFENFNFDLVVGQSPEVRAKPKLDGFKKIVAHGGLTPAEIAYVGDSEVDLKTARSASVGLEIFCSYGFRTLAEVKEMKPRFVAESPFDIWTVIESQSPGRKRQELYFMLLSLLGFAMPAVSAFLLSHFYAGTPEGTGGLALGLVTVGSGVLFYLPSLIRRRPFSRYGFVALVSTLMAGVFFLLFFHAERAGLFGSGNVETILYLAGFIVFLLIPLLIGVGFTVAAFSRKRRRSELEARRRARQKYLVD